MSTPLATNLRHLLTLQQIDSELQRKHKAQSALDNGDKAKAEAATAQRSAAEKLRSAHSLAGELKDSELKLSGIESKQKNSRQRLYAGTVTNPKELASIEKEIDALTRQRADLDGRILELMDQSEAAQTASVLAEASARQAEAHVQEVQATYRSRHEALNTEITDLTRQRNEMSAQIDDLALLKRYEDIRAKHSGVGIAALDGKNCGACHMALPSTLVASVKEGGILQFCDNCGRMLTTPPAP